MTSATPMAWYAVHTFTGFEQKAKLALEERVKTHNLQDQFGQILIPEEQVVERTKTGKNRTTSRRFLPGYMLVQMNLNNQTWHLVMDTPKVAGFVGDKTKPPRVPEAEVARLLGWMEKGAVQVKPKVTFEKGEGIRVTDGPFANFNGVVDEVRPEKGRLRVMVSIFGRATPVDLEFTQVQKIG